MATRNSSVGSFGAVPELVIDQDDVSGSQRTFCQDFALAIELKELELDIRQGTYEDALDLLDYHYGKKENIFV